MERKRLYYPMAHSRLQKLNRLDILYIMDYCGIDKNLYKEDQTKNNLINTLIREEKKREIPTYEEYIALRTGKNEEKEKEPTPQEEKIEYLPLPLPSNQPEPEERFPKEEEIRKLPQKDNSIKRKNVKTFDIPLSDISYTELKDGYIKTNIRKCVKIFLFALEMGLDLNFTEKEREKIVKEIMYSEETITKDYGINVVPYNENIDEMEEQFERGLNLIVEPSDDSLVLKKKNDKYAQVFIKMLI